MRTCSPTEFVQRWPGSLRPVLAAPAPALPEDCQRSLSEYGLPAAVKIECYIDITLAFSGTATPLATIWQRDLARGLQLSAPGRKPGEMPDEWKRFWHLADQEYLQGGGWICIEEITGRLVVIDLDQTDPVYLLSSSVGSFYTILAYFLEWTNTTDGGAEATKALRDALRRQDCIAADELEPFWLNFVEATLDCGPMRLAVVLNPPAQPL